MGSKLYRYAKLPIEDVLPLITGAKKPEERPLLLGVPCHTNGLRLFTFKTKGCDCVLCGLKGSWFAIERNPTKPHQTVNRDADIPADVGEPYHLNLYAMKDGVEILMTHDHILARALGGPHHSLSNSQPACEICNGLKAQVEARQVEEDRRKVGMSVKDLTDKYKEEGLSHSVAEKKAGNDARKHSSYMYRSLLRSGKISVS